MRTQSNSQRSNSFASPRAHHVPAAFALAVDIVSLSPLECMLSYNYYTSLVTHTVLPLLAVAALLLTKTVSKAIGRPAVGTRCVTAAFYIIFFICATAKSNPARPLATRCWDSTALSCDADPSVSAKIFTTFNCETFDGEFDGSNSWMRVDLTVDCNASDRGAWIAYAAIMSACPDPNRPPMCP